ncbi:unnamed protein product [Acanthoscelides obtectus]|uniref:Large ribosomal subunit protein mL38 n=1 Tax=Acanthoscelides obtectus TaxID=200917 RepID=A0A9P0NYH2_ACAOB|nr:unnamed protein product [Acanthoscelides obtectus]CAK1657120.1 39S ribosomal protein L38, mitochondrial [Acanthoscelides obtectus]
MALTIRTFLHPKLNNSAISCFKEALRHGHHLRGKPPGVAKSLEQKLEESRYKDPALHYRVDIGLPPPKVSRSQQLQERLKVLKGQKANPALEKVARSKELLINLEEVRKDSATTSAPIFIKNIADHYGVFEHLFGDAYFYPRVPLSIVYESGELDLPVFCGNTIKPNEAKGAPKISYDCDKDSLWTLVLTNPDGHFTEKDKEYVHWFIGNIPGNNVEQGETIVQYLQPFPPKGTGYHRHIFILYKQEKKVDFSKYKKNGPCLNLPDRTFSTYDFYRVLQDDLTPSGLAFFHSDWDTSLKEFYHQTLEMKEPIFEYDFPPPYVRKQEWFPLRKPFNLYMDKYRDPKQINKEFLMRKMKHVHPFKEPPPPLPYPNAQYFDGYIPSWLKLEKRKSRLRWGRINDIE